MCMYVVCVVCVVCVTMCVTVAVVVFAVLCCVCACVCDYVCGGLGCVCGARSPPLRLQRCFLGLLSVRVQGASWHLHGVLGFKGGFLAFACLWATAS